MVSRAPALGMAAGVAILLLLGPPPAAAQVPGLPTDPSSAAIGFAVVCPNQYLEVDFAGLVRTTCQVIDVTRDSAPTPTGEGTSGSAILHRVEFVVLNQTPEVGNGWLVQVDPFVQLYGGETREIQVTFFATPTIKVADFFATIEATYYGPNDRQLKQTLDFVVQVNEYDLAYVTMLDPIRKVGQDEIVEYQVQITNLGVFPDSYEVTVLVASDHYVTPPPRAYLQPGETKNLTFRILTPHSKLYEIGRAVPVNVLVKSVGPFGTGSYSTFASMQMRGFYVPVYWIPLTLVGLVAASVAITKGKEQAEIRRLERGRPRRVLLTPRQEVLLAELRRTDPEAYKARREQLNAIYAARRARYRNVHREQVKADREEHRLARIEYKEAKKRQRAEDREAAKAAAAEKKRLRAERAAQRKVDKVDAKKLRAKEKVLAKKRKKLEKAQAKQARRDAKQAAKDAKAEAKAAKAQAKADKAAAKAAKKAAKEASKKAK